MSKPKTLNKYDLSGEYGVGYFTDGSQFLFDKEDYDKIKDFHWCKGNNSAISNIKKNKTGTIIRVMHRVILFGDKYESSKKRYSFKNGNRFDCRKENLMDYCPKGIVGRKKKSTEKDKESTEE